MVKLESRKLRELNNSLTTSGLTPKSNFIEGFIEMQQCGERVENPETEFIKTIKLKISCFETSKVFKVF